eukprot:s1875_g6.t2
MNPMISDGVTFMFSFYNDCMRQDLNPFFALFWSFGDLQPFALRRYSLWMPHVMTRQTVFRLLGLFEQFMDQPEHCNLWHNHVTIVEHPAGPIHVDDGDFLQIYIGPPRRGPQPSEEDDAMSLTQIPSTIFSATARPRSTGDSAAHASSSSHRPPDAHHPAWVHEVWDLIDEHGATELEEEGPIIYVNSYYISHLRHLRCTRSRPLRFDRDFVGWEEAVRFIWEDVVDPMASIVLHVVLPDPPMTVQQGTVATVLVVQHPILDRTACLISSIIGMYPVTRIWELAQSLDVVIRTDTLIDIAGVCPLCDQRAAQGFGHCHIRIGHQIQPLDRDIRLRDGLGLQIRVPAPLTPDQAEDALRRRLMQTQPLLPQQQAGQPPLREEDLPHILHAGRIHDPGPLHLENEEEYDDAQLWTHSFTIHPSSCVDSTSSFVHHPLLRDIADHEVLQHIWSTTSIHFTLADGLRRVPFAVWYLRGGEYPICPQPRIVALSADRADWERQVLLSWHDRFQPGGQYRIVLVRPAVEPCEQAGHLLILQHELPGERGVLFSSFWHEDASQLRSRIALFLPSSLTLNRLWNLVGASEPCQNRRWICLGYKGRSLLDDSLPFRVQAGEHLEAHAAPWADVDENDLLQLSIGKSKPTAIALDVPGHDELEQNRFCFRAEAPAFNPDLPPLNTQDEFIQDLFAHWDASALAWEEGDRSANVMTFFVNQQDLFPRCDQGRSVRLSSNYATWKAALLRAWLDRITPGVSIEFFIVTPTPPQPEPDHAAYVLIVQGPQDDLVTSLVTLFDGQGHLFQRSAVTTFEHVYPQHLLQVLGYLHFCTGPTAQFTCLTWHRTDQLRLEDRIMGRNGLSFVIQLAPIPPSSHGVSLLQKSVKRLRGQRTESRAAVGGERLTDGRMAFNRRPHPIAKAEIDSLVDDEEQFPALSNSSRTSISLEELLPVSKPIRLRSSSDDLSVPHIIELVGDITEEAVQIELRHWGVICAVHQFGGHDEFLCIPQDGSPASGHHYMYCTEEGRDPSAAFLHTHHGPPLGVLDHMKLLHRMDFLKTAIVREEVLQPQWSRVIFVHHQPQVQGQTVPQRQPTAWEPSSSPSTQIPFDPSRIQGQCGPCRLTLGISKDDLIQYFRGDAFPLCTTFEGLQLPETTAKVPNIVWNECLPLDQYDRFVLFADGSSLSHLRHQPPLLTDAQGYPDTWAFVALGEVYHPSGSQLYLIGWQAQPVHYQEDSRFFIGTDRVGSGSAEKEAMIWAALWRLSVNLPTPTLFCTDSSTTSGQAQGLLGTADYTLPFVLLRSAFQALEAMLGEPFLKVKHVRGHSTDPWNDLVDYIAKAERDRSFYLPRPPSMDMKVWSKALPSLWMVFRQDAGLPTFKTDGFDAPAPQLPLSVSGDLSTESSPPPQVAVDLDLSFGTVNVLSLSVGPHGHGGRVDYLRRQFCEHHINLIGLQETRTAKGLTSASKVLRIASGADRGHFGVELWVNLLQPYGYLAAQPLFFHRRHFVVLHADPRVLLVRVQAPYLSFLCLVLHAPQSGLPLSERQQWWDDLRMTVDLHRNVEVSDLFVLADANAASGPRDECIVGPFDDVVTANTSLFRDFLESYSLCLPSTFLSHHGTHTTWTSPGGDLECRIDHVAVPQARRSQCTFSSVVEQFDVGHVRLDHSLVAIQLQWRQLHRQAVRAPAAVVRFERDCFNRDSIRGQLVDYVVESWDTNIETQVDAFNRHVAQALVKAHPVRKQGPKKPILKLESLFTTWKSWKTGTTDQVLRDENAAYVTTLQCYTLKHFVHLHVLAAQLRQQLCRAKHDLLQSCIDDLPHGASAGQILRAVHKFQGPTNPKKIKRRPFPMLQRQDGSLCQTPQELQDRWAEFFCNMEGGYRLSFPDLRSQWIQNLQKFQQNQFDLHLGQLPTLCDLERAFARVTTGRAMGMDNVPPELCKVNSKELARMTFSQLLKMCLHGHEALPHKGGRLTAAFKGKGRTDLCESYRSLLVSSQVGKCLHRTIRESQSSLYEAYMQNQQVGGRKHIPVSLGMHHLRAFLRHQKDRGCSCGVLFLDLKEAFYRVMRPLALHSPWTDSAIADVVKRLRLPESVLSDLHAHLQAPCALEAAALPRHLRNCISAIHTDTWFVVDGQHIDVCKTTAGSRPGDCFADTVFGYLWSRLLRSLEDQCAQLQLLEEFPILEAINPFTGAPLEHEPQGTRSFLGPCWMDDLAIPVAGTTAAEVVQKLGVLAGLLIDRCMEFAMTPNLAAGKTEIVLALRGRGSRALRQRFYGAHGGRLFPVIGEHGMFHISVVSRYRHLGGIIHHAGDQRQEAQQKL